jgi:hypothetical protein
LAKFSSDVAISTFDWKIEIFFRFLAGADAEADPEAAGELGLAPLLAPPQPTIAVNRVAAVNKLNALFTFFKTCASPENYFL